MRILERAILLGLFALAAAFPAMASQEIERECLTNDSLPRTTAYSADADQDFTVWPPPNHPARVPMMLSFTDHQILHGGHTNVAYATDHGPPLRETFGAAGVADQVIGHPHNRTPGGIPPLIV